MSSCEWPIDRTCLTDLPTLGDTPTDEEQAAYDSALLARNAAEDVAVSVLWALSGRQFGVCRYTVRPCIELMNRWSHPADYLAPGVLAWDGDNWLNVGCGCTQQCQRNGPRAAHLPGPAVSIVSVTVGATLLSPTSYVLENNTLYRIGADWPRQNLGHPLGESDTWSVDYRRGVPVPAGVGRLTGLLAEEFYNACSGGKCRLPRNVTAVTRAGVSYQVYDPNSIYAAGKTGLAEIDLWLASVNPHHAMSAPSVL